MIILFFISLDVKHGHKTFHLLIFYLNLMHLKMLSTRLSCTSLHQICPSNEVPGLVVVVVVVL